MSRRCRALCHQGAAGYRKRQDTSDVCRGGRKQRAGKHNALGCRDTRPKARRVSSGCESRRCRDGDYREDYRVELEKLAARKKDRRCEKRELISDLVPGSAGMLIQTSQGQSRILHFKYRCKREGSVR